MPLTRVIAVSMLATLISTVFAFPAQADPATITNVSSAGAGPVLPGTAFSYTVVVTNDDAADTDVTVTNTLSNATLVSASYVLSSAGVSVACAGTGPVMCGGAGVSMIAAETMTITINVTAGVADTAATNAVSVDTANSAPTAGPLATTTVENADLQVTKTHSPLVVNPGSSFTYTIAIKNNGPSIASAVTLADSAPTGVTFGTISLSSSDAVSYTCPGATSTSLPCALGTIASGTTVTLTVNATLAASAMGVISNMATVSSSTLDAAAANNSSTDPLTATSVDLGVSIAVDPTTAAPGDTVTYTVSVSNPNTTTDATNVVVVDALPTGLTAVTPPTAPTLRTVAVAGNTWTWTIPTVVKATSSTTPTVVTATFDAVIDPTTTLTTITNTATMTATEFDPDATNNTASVDLAIVASVSDLDITTAADDSKPDQGDTIAIGIQVSNHGPADATNVVFKDILPAGLKFKSCTGCSGTHGRRAWTRTFTAASIPVDSAVTIILNVTVQASDGTLKNTASVVSSDQSDPDGTNDKDSLNIIVGGTNGSGSGSDDDSTGDAGGTSTTAFTGSTVGQLTPWFMLLITLGLIALEWARRMRPVTPIGSTYGFDVPF